MELGEWDGEQRNGANAAVPGGMGLPASDLHDLPARRSDSPEAVGSGASRFHRSRDRTRCAPFSRRADELGVPVHRVSQGSGVMLLTDDELDEMHEIAAARGIEVSLFVGPRAGWDTGAMAYTHRPGGSCAPKVRGEDQLVQAVEDVRAPASTASKACWSPMRGCSKCWARCETRRRAAAGLILKGSVMLGAVQPGLGAEPGTARV